MKKLWEAEIQEGEAFKKELRDDGVNVEVKIITLIVSIGVYWTFIYLYQGCKIFDPNESNE